MKKLFALFLAMIMALSLVACGGGAKEEPKAEEPKAEEPKAEEPAKDDGSPVIKIGALMPFSGTSARNGECARYGIDLAVKEINAAGGIQSMGGAKIEVIYADSQSDATVGVTETEKLINVEKVDLMLGSFNSAVTLPCTAVAEKAKIPWIVNSATSDAITEQGNKYTFRAYYVNSTGTSQMVQMIHELGEANNDPIKTVSIFYEDSEGGQSWAAGTREACEKYGMEIVFDEGYPPGTTDFLTPVTKMKAAKADAILDFSYISEALLVGQTIADMEVEAKALVGWGGHASPEFMVNDFAEGWIVPTSWAADLNDPDSLEFVEKCLAEYPHETVVDSVSANGYNDMWMIKEILEASGTTEADAFRETMLNIEIDGGRGNIVKGTGPVIFGENGQNPNASQIGTQMIDGAYRTVWPVKYATDKYETIWPYN